MSKLPWILCCCCAIFSKVAAQDFEEDLSDLPVVTTDSGADLSTLPAVVVSPATPEAEKIPESKPDEPLPPAAETVVVEAARLRLDPAATGSRVFNQEEIQALSGSSGDPNELLEIAPNVQFDLGRGRLNADTAGDLSPTKISIAGGRFYENNFIVDGISTNSQLDVISARSFDNTTGSTQSVFLDSDLLSEFEVIDSNVPAEYGQFLGGVVRATTRDPRNKFGFSLNSSYTSSNWTQFLVRSEDKTDPLPAKTTFERQRYGGSIDIPFRQDLTALFAFTRAEAVVTRGALSSSYFGDERPRTTLKDNYLAKFVYTLNPDTTLRLQTIYTPYEDEYWRTNLSTQYGGGSSTKINFERKFDSSTFETNLAYTTTENSREEDPNHFIYRRTDSITWVPPSRSSANAGGFGNLDVSQEELQVDLKHRFVKEKSRFSYGAQINSVNAERSRPETNYGYRAGQLSGGKPITADDLNDGTIIQNEQFLTERNDYLAFKSEAQILQLALFSDYARDFRLHQWLTITPVFGLRYDYDDFLTNHNISPRLSTNFLFPYGINLSLGANRYHARNQLAYKLREQNPDNFVYRRRATFNGAEFAVGDWTIFRRSSSSAFANGSLETPYADELSAALTVPVWELGEVRIKGITRKNKDGLARSEPIRTTGFDQNGKPYNFNRFELTNRGQSEYQSLSLEYNKSWRNHTFTASTTFSETKLAPGTDNYFSNTDLELENEMVYYNGALVNYSQLDVQRSNYATPFYIAFGVVSRWFDDSLITGLRGRFRGAYDSIESADETVNENGEPGGGFELYEDVSLRAQFLLDATISYTFPLSKNSGEMELELKIDNILNSYPNVRVTDTQPYQEGRAFWVGAKYRF